MPPAVKELILYVPNDIIVSTTSNTGMVVNYPAAKTTGGRQPVKISYSEPSGVRYPIGLSIITVTAKSKDGQVKSGSFSIYVQLATTPLSLTVPSNITVQSDNPVAVSYPPATVSGGVPPYTITYNPISGSIFPIGDTTVKVTATSSDGQIVTGGFIIRVEQVVPPIPPPPGTHPRIWLNTAVQANISAKQASSDADWLTIKAEADDFATRVPPRIRVSSATNSNPVEFTTVDPLPWGSGDVFMSIAGGTGNWSQVNKGGTDAVTLDTWVATKTAANKFTIPVNSSTFGTFGGQSLTGVIFGGEGSAYFAYGQTASGWYDALLEMGIVYRTIGGSQYVNAALALMDWINELAAVGLLYPTTQDTGRGVTAVLAMSIGYDWFFDSLSVARRNAAIVTINLWADWHINNNVYWNSSTAPTSNYWMNNVTAIFAAAYATQDENAHAASLLASAQNEWNTYGDPYLFQAPSTTNPGYNTAQGLYYGGLAVSGFNYGANDISRYIKYFFMVQTATGSPLANTITYAKRFIRSLIYQLKPDLWKATNWGQWTGAWYGLMTYTEALMLSHFLDGFTEGGWAQWMYKNTGPNAAGFPGGALTFAQPGTQDRVMFYKASRTATDYRSTEALAFLSDGGEAIFTTRTDWTNNAVHSHFKVTPSHYSASTPKCAANIDIARGTDYLLVQACYWKGTGDGTNGSPEQAYTDGGATSNTLFYQRVDGLGPDGFTGDVYNGGQLGGFRGVYSSPKTKIATNYTFAENEFSTIYDFSGALTDKDVMYFFRSDVVLMDSGVHVVWDRIKSKDSGDFKQLRWHGPSNPTISGGVASYAVGSSKVYIKPLLPASASISSEQVTGGPYRLKVEDPVPAQILNGLTVLFPTSSVGALPTTALLDIVDSNFTGCQISDSTPKVVIVPVGVVDDGAGNFTSKTYSSCTFSSNHAGTGQYVICGLASGTYTVRRGGVNIGTVIVGTDGTAYFTSTSGNFTIT